MYQMMRFHGTAPIEIHTLLCHEHVPRYLVALASLARFWPAPAVVAHDDGTLTPSDRGTLAGVVGGLRVIARAEADAAVEAALADRPLVRRVRANNPRIRQLVDYFALARAPRVIGLDSDVVFFRSPQALIDTVHKGPDLAYSPEHGWQPKGVHWLPDAVPGAPFVADLCCGVISADVAAFFDTGYLEGLMARTDPEILGQQRFVTQMFYSLMAGRLGPDRAQSLGEPYRSGRLEWLPDRPDRVLCHYFGSHDGVDPLPALVDRDPQLREVAAAVATAVAA